MCVLDKQKILAGVSDGDGAVAQHAPDITLGEGAKPLLDEEGEESEWNWHWANRMFGIPSISIPIITIN